MHQIERQVLIARVRFGFDTGALHLRIDASRPLSEVLADGVTVLATFLRPANVRVGISAGRVAPTASVWVRDTDRWVPSTSAGIRAAAGSILEVSIPLAVLSDTRPTELAFFVAVSDRAGIELERHPAARPIELQVPDERFAAQNWTA